MVGIVNTEKVRKDDQHYKVYKVSDYLPQDIWTSSTRYSLLADQIPPKLETLININKDTGQIPSTADDDDDDKGVLTVRLNYNEIGQVSLERVPNLDFGSHVRQNVSKADTLNLQHDEKQKLIVKDTTQRNTTDPNWQLFLKIDPLDNNIGHFIYKYKDGSRIDVSSNNIIASYRDSDLNTNEVDINISNSWWNDNKQQIKGPKLVLDQSNPPVGKYTTTATWTIQNVP